MRALQSRSARTSTLGAQLTGEVSLTSHEVRALQFVARMTPREVRAPQLGARMTACEVRALPLQERYSISIICGARITVVKCAHLNSRRATHW